MNEINDLRQYMDVSYVMQIGWRDHRLASIGLCLSKMRSIMLLSLLIYFQTLIIIVVALLTLSGWAVIFGILSKGASIKHVRTEGEGGV